MNNIPFSVNNITERNDSMKREKIRGYGSTQKSVTFKDNLKIFGLCIACIAVIGITFLISGAIRTGDGEKTQVSQKSSESTDTEDVEEVEYISATEKEADNSPKEEQKSENSSEAGQEKPREAEVRVSEVSETVNEDDIYGTESVVSADAGAVILSAPLSGKLLKGHSTAELVYSKTLEDWRIHNGIDIGAKKGATVCSAAKGTVEDVSEDIMYGYTVVVNHGNNIKTVYCNLTGTDMVKIGESVEKGEPIGQVGSSAICETLDESHLHFEVIVDGKQINPLNYFSL